MGEKRHEPTLQQLRDGLSLPTGVKNVVVVPAKAKVRLVEVTPHFAPGKQIFDDGDPANAREGDKCTIKYEVTDPFGSLTEARLEISRKSKEGTPLAKLRLEPAAYTDGTHELEWDGLCTEGAMAGKYIHALHSPYVVRLVAKGPAGEVEDKGKQTAILLEEIRLDRGRYVPANQPPAPGSNAHYQLRLTVLGFHPGQIDGNIGQKTKRAIKNFQRAHAGLKVTGTLDAYTKAYLDEKAPPGTGVDHYQFILNHIGYRCGTIDGLVGKKTRRAVRQYRTDKGFAPGDVLDDAVKAALDGEALSPLPRREILEKDLDFAEPDQNPFPAPGTEKKLFIDGDSSFSPGDLPYKKKFETEKKNLCRPHFPVVVSPLVKARDGKRTFAPGAVGPMKIDFTVDGTPPPADLGIPDATARAFAQAAMSRDGGEANTGHHAHQNRGGVRTNHPGVFLDQKSYTPYDVSIDGHKFVSTCVDKPDAPARGTAGLYFVPSTLAGERYTLVATVRAEGFDTAPAAPITVKTGTMISWRRYRIAKLWLMQYVPRPHRTETHPQLGLPDWYEPAFIEFVEPDANPRPLMVQPRAADHQQIDLTLYTAILREAGYRPAQLPDALIQQRFNANILWPLRPAAAYNPADEQGYYDAIDAEITSFEERFALTLRELSYLETNEGLVVLVFDKNAPTAGTHGVHAVVNPQYADWAWSLLAAERVVHLIHDQDNSPPAIDGETLAHEAGHSLWLHHASTAAGQLPEVDDQAEHNPPEWQTCTMSYVSLANFCGHCVLKLRGWDETKV